MSLLAGLRSPEAQRLIARAARAAGMPLSIHFVERNQEGALVAGAGRCAACAKVAEQEGGRQACRASRVTAAAMAIRQDRPIPFICHMGFACAAVAAFEGEGFVLVFGPFCPSEESRSLEADVAAGWAALDTGTETPAFTLDDIHRIPASAVPALAEWTLETLRAHWAGQERPEEVQALPEEVGEEPEARPRAKSPATLRGGYAPTLATDVAAALAGGDQPRARQLVKGALEEAANRPRVPLAQRRARILATVAQALEAAEAAKLATRNAWDAWPAFLEQLRAAGNDSGLVDAAMVPLGVLRRRSAGRREAGQPRAKTAYAELNAVLKGRLEEGVTLEEVAERLKESPSAISHRLKRDFGMHYSDYLARMRIDKAKGLLRRTKLSATQIARRVGIADQSHFSKLFRKFEGLSPTEYRGRYGRKK